MKRYGVIMAGGGGTRFWPLSRQAMPKQMLNLSGKDRMINETIDRLHDTKIIFWQSRLREIQQPASVMQRWRS